MGTRAASRAVGRPTGRAASLVVGAVVLALSGCTAEVAPAPAPVPTAATTPPASPTAEEPTDLDVVVYGDQPRVDAYDDVVAAFEDAHPTVRVRLKSYDTAADAAEAVQTFGGSDLAPDVFLLDAAYLASFVEQGLTDPVDTLLEDRGLQFGDDYQRAALSAFGANARLQCMPVEMSPLVVYYNKRLLAKPLLALRGIALPELDGSWGWQAFVAAARAAAYDTRGRPTGVKGAYVPTDIDTMTAFIRSAGGDVVDDVYNPTSLTLTGDDAVAALQEVGGLTRDPRLSPSERELAARSPAELFADSRLAMYVGTRDDLPLLRETEKLRFDVLPLPSLGRSRSVARIAGLCLGSGGTKPTAAADFVAFAAGTEAATIAARSGVIVPTNLGAAVTEAFTQPDEQPRSATVYLRAARASEPLPFSTGWIAVRERADAVLGRLLGSARVDLDTELVPRLERLNQQSVTLFESGGSAAEG